MPIVSDPMLNCQLTISSGEKYLPLSIFAVWDILQFWQNGHLKLHPTVPMENAFEFGKKWYRGFFSIGSIATTDG